MKELGVRAQSIEQGRRSDNFGQISLKLQRKSINPISNSLDSKISERNYFTKRKSSSSMTTYQSGQIIRGLAKAESETLKNRITIQPTERRKRPFFKALFS